MYEPFGYFITCDAVARVALHPLPHVEHRAACRIHHHAPDLSQRLEVRDRHAKRGQDHHVIGADAAEVEPSLGVGLQDLDPHRAQLGVDVRVVDDLTHEHEVPVGKLATRLVGVLHRPLHAVAEPELPRQADRHVAHDEHAVLRAHAVHDASGIVGIEVFLDVGLEAESLPEVRG
jgi:hypothetical protein